MANKIETNIKQRAERIETPLVVNGQVLFFGRVEHGLLNFFSNHPGLHDSFEIAANIFGETSKINLVNKGIRTLRNKLAETNQNVLISTEQRGRKSHGLAESVAILDFSDSPQGEIFMDGVNRYLDKYPDQKLFGPPELLKATGRIGDVVGEYARQIIKDVYQEFGGVDKNRTILLTRSGFSEACRRLGPPNLSRVEKGLANAKKRYGNIKGLNKKTEPECRKKARKTSVVWSSNTTFEERVERFIRESPPDSFSISDAYRLRGKKASKGKAARVRTILTEEGITGLHPAIPEKTFRKICYELDHVNTNISDQVIEGPDQPTLEVEPEISRKENKLPIDPNPEGEHIIFQAETSQPLASQDLDTTNQVPTEIPEVDKAAPIEDQEFYQPEEIVDKEKAAWENQAKIEREKTAANLAKTLLTHTAYSAISRIDSNNISDLLSAALPTYSSYQIPVNLGLIAKNDPRIEKLTREEAKKLFEELLPLVEKTIKSYWDLEPDNGILGQDRIFVKACKEIKRKVPNATPDIIIKKVQDHFSLTV